MLKIISDQKPYISGTAFKNDIYLFEQLHFHWGGSIRRGSEHAIDGKTHSMEVVMNPYNQNSDLLIKWYFLILDAFSPLQSKI
jgi:carbonic anhydrase